MMITLMLALALITLAMLAVLPSLKQQIMRDREEELMHRGNSYMRAIQHFYKKFGRYPTRVEDLENTNNLRFLRKRYTDPINIDPITHKERDFKLLRQQDITLNNGPVLPGQSGPAAGATQGGDGATAGGSSSAPQTGPSSLGTPLGGTQTGPGAQTPASGDSGSSSSPGSSSGGSSSGTASSGNASDEEKENAPASSPSNSNSGPNPNGQTFGGGPILGVASTSKHKTIRVFFDKNHYNDWFFIYLPQADLGGLGGLLTGPINPNGPSGGGLIAGQPPGGTPGQGGTGQSGFGSGLGQGLTPSGSQSPILQPAPQTPGPAQGPQQ